MPKPRLRLRTLIILVSAIALVLGAARQWRKEQPRRAALSARGSSYAQFATFLRLKAKTIPKNAKLGRLRIGHNSLSAGYEYRPEAPGLSRAEAERAYLLKAAEYDRLGVAYRRAATWPWLSSSPPGVRPAPFDYDQPATRVPTGVPSSSQ